MFSKRWIGFSRSFAANSPPTPNSRTASAADLKKMAKDSKLASPSDVAGKSKEAVIELIQRRATLRIESRRSDV